MKQLEIHTRPKWHQRASPSEIDEVVHIDRLIAELRGWRGRVMFPRGCPNETGPPWQFNVCRCGIDDYVRPNPSTSVRTISERDPHEMTALGVISENVREIYASEVEACYQEAGKASRGPKFLDCLQRHVLSQKDALDATYDSRMSYLSSHSPELAASLQHAQAAWLQFRDANCAFIRSIARASHADEALQNCVLRTTIYRRVQLRWLVGD